MTIRDIEEINNIIIKRKNLGLRMIRKSLKSSRGKLNIKI